MRSNRCRDPNPRNGQGLGEGVKGTEREKKREGDMPVPGSGIKWWVKKKEAAN